MLYVSTVLKLDRKSRDIVRLGEMYMRCVRICYYNVTFDLVVNTEKDLYVIKCLTDCIREGMVVTMRDIEKWCMAHNIEYQDYFSYRYDFPIKANLWNLYSYWRFCLWRLSIKINSHENFNK